jgi:DNA repair exonuclease SbcCD ATPase subunit
MKNVSTAFLVIMLISSLSLWGCSNQKNTAFHNKVRDLEARYGKLEEDYRGSVAANDSTRKKLAQMEVQRQDLTQQVEDLKGVVAERDELKKQLGQRSAERDNAQAQLLQFRGDLLNLLGRVEAATAGFGGTLQATPTSLKKE